MNTSTKLLIPAIVVLFGTTIAYDFALKDVYEKGSYKDPMRDFSRLDYKNFDEVIINSAHFLEAEIIYSDSFEVMVANSVKPHVTIFQKGSQLIIGGDLNLQNDRSKSIIIKCPAIKYVMTDATQNINEAKSFSLPNYTARRTTKIKGFNLDSLQLIIYNASQIDLENNRIGNLDVEMGGVSLSDPNLKLDKTNLIDHANLNMQQKSKLTLDDVAINHFKDMTAGPSSTSKADLTPVGKLNADKANINRLEYSISGDAQINLSGVSLGLIKKK